MNHRFYTVLHASTQISLNMLLNDTLWNVKRGVPRWWTLTWHMWLAMPPATMALCTTTLCISFWRSRSVVQLGGLNQAIICSAPLRFPGLIDWKPRQAQFCFGDPCRTFLSLVPSRSPCLLWAIGWRSNCQRRRQGFFGQPSLLLIWKGPNIGLMGGCPSVIDVIDLPTVKVKCFIFSACLWQILREQKIESLSMQGRLMLNFLDNNDLPQAETGCSRGETPDSTKLLKMAGGYWGFHQKTLAWEAWKCVIILYCHTILYHNMYIYIYYIYIYIYYIILHIILYNIYI